MRRRSPSWVRRAAHSSRNRRSRCLRSQIETEPHDRTITARRRPGRRARTTRAARAPPPRRLQPSPDARSTRPEPANRFLRDRHARAPGPLARVAAPVPLRFSSFPVPRSRHHPWSQATKKPGTSSVGRASVWRVWITRNHPPWQKRGRLCPCGPCRTQSVDQTRIPTAGRSRPRRERAPARPRSGHGLGATGTPVWNAIRSLTSTHLLDKFR